MFKSQIWNFLVDLTSRCYCIIQFDNQQSQTAKKHVCARLISNPFLIQANKNQYALIPHTYPA